MSPYLYGTSPGASQANPFWYNSSVPLPHTPSTTNTTEIQTPRTAGSSQEDLHDRMLRSILSRTVLNSGNIPRMYNQFGNPQYYATHTAWVPPPNIVAHPGPLIAQHDHQGTQQPTALQPVSQNYQGNRHALRNQCALIGLEESTSVWITNLPPICTHADVLRKIRDTGKIYASVINKPQHPFLTSAAKIVFFDVEGRKRLERSADRGEFTVGSYTPQVRLNRILTSAQPFGPESRVLQICGLPQFVNKDVLMPWFQFWCTFDLEDLQTWPNLSPLGTVTMVWTFGSFRCQAERVLAKIQAFQRAHIEGTLKSFWIHVTVRYGPDPCDRINSA
ncbi:hypothetical protein F4808DRAFT_468939 [Astrocystis sublimbata]|nr:hypothetical protein F4808DRAFT_468939 [Astrocystis sublimbata]